MTFNTYGLILGDGNAIGLSMRVIYDIPIQFSAFTYKLCLYASLVMDSPISQYFY